MLELGRRRKKTEPRDVKKIRRSTHTDYRLVFDKESQVWLLCFGAVIELSSNDVDFDYFEECGRTGITTVTIHGNGAMEFDEEDMELEDKEYVFAEHPSNYFPYRPHACPRNICPPSSNAIHATNIVLEMV